MQILVIQHDALCGLDMFERTIEDCGVELTCVRPDTGDQLPTDYHFDGVIALGAPFFVWQTDKHPWVQQEVRFIRDIVETHQRPFLGICFGHQLLAQAIGANVRAMSMPECGLHPVVLNEKGQTDPLFRDIGRSVDCLQWHASEVENLPSSADILASSEQCAIQVMRVGKHAYGVQGHFEVGAKSLENWANTPIYAQTFSRANPNRCAQSFSAYVKSRERELRATADNLSRNFIEIVQRHKTHCSQ